MKDARILKIKKINQNSLRQMIDLEEMLRYGIPAVTFFIAFILTPGLNLQARITVVGLVGICCWMLLSHEIDRQPAYTLLVPYIKYLFSVRKGERLKEVDFDLVDNLMVFKGKIVSAFKLEPVDIMLLSEQDRQIFIKNIQAFLNNQRGIHVQILMRNRGAEQSDYIKHFDHVTTQQVHLRSRQMADLRDRKLAGYIDDMQELLDRNIVPIRDYFMLLEIKCDTSTAKKTITGIRDLEELSERVTGLLDNAKIRTYQLREYQLEEFLKQFIRDVC